MIAPINMTIRREKNIKFLCKDITGFWTCDVCRSGGQDIPIYQIEFITYAKFNEYGTEIVQSVFCLRVCEKCKEEFFT